MHAINETHDPELKSWLASANAADGDFPIQNLPFGIFDDGKGPRGGVALGDRVIDIAALIATGALSGPALGAAQAASGPSLAPLFSRDRHAASALRAALSRLFRTGGTGDRAGLEAALIPMGAARMQLPTKVEAFTDFCTSLHHIRRMGANGPVPERLAWTHLPVAYNGRAASVAVDGTPVVRPKGQFETPLGSGTVIFGPEPMLDFELEFGVWVGGGSVLGTPLNVQQAQERLFGCCLVNDWSARAIQFFEAVLGPYCGKSCLTTISPWVVTMEALAPFRTAATRRDQTDAPVPDHLFDARDQAAGGLAVELKADIVSAKMREAGSCPFTVTTTHLGHLHWTLAQMAAHATSSGSPLLLGELIASGTVSGPSPQERACLAEINKSAEDAPLILPDGEQRGWLQDGDTIRITGKARADGFVPIGFGSCSGTIEAAR